VAAITGVETAARGRQSTLAAATMVTIFMDRIP
jgi:hypothetical protein